MNQAQLDILVCPACKGRLHWDAAQQELVCEADKLAFPVKDGIPYMLVTEARAWSPESAPTATQE